MQERVRQRRLRRSRFFLILDEVMTTATTCNVTLRTHTAEVEQEKQKVNNSESQVCRRLTHASFFVTKRKHPRISR